jgi:hypothetical protein
MSKNRKRSPQAPQAKVSHRYPVALPEVVNVDDLAVQSDDELINWLRILEDDRVKVLEACLEPKQWEEEISYIRRELQIRRARREAHDNYVKQFERKFVESEEDLPVADLDNTYFLKLAEGLN